MTKRITEQLTPDQLRDYLSGNRGSVARARGGVSDELAKESAKQKREALEMAFLFAWRGIGGPEPLRQHQFDEVRKYRFDFCWQPQRLAVEINGGQFVNGGHNRGKGMQSDLEKKRLAISQGWRVMEFGTEDMACPVQVAEQVLKILKGNQ